MNYMQYLVVSRPDNEIKPIRCRHLMTVYFSLGSVCLSFLLGIFWLNF